MVFTKPIKDITYNDIETFCNQQIRENVHIDYKEDFNNKKPVRLAKTMAAFANTYGGLIIIGVKDDDGVPVLPAEGIDYKKGLHERVTKIIIDNTNPIFFPEIAVCRNKANNKAFVVIRIPQSNNGPHAIIGNTETYLRINDIKNPEVLATMEQIDWLKNKREKSNKLKESIILNAKHRHEKRLYEEGDEEKMTMISPSNAARDIPYGHGFIYAVPLYPNNILSSPDDIYDFFENLCIDDYYGTYSKFPRLYEGRKVASNAVIIKEDNNSYTEVNEFGLFYHGENLLKDVDKLLKKQGRITILPGKINKHVYEYYRFYQLIARLDESLEAFYLFFKKLGYWGYVEIKFGLEDLHNNCLYFDDGRPLREDSMSESVDDDFVWDRIISVQDLEDKRVELIKDFCKKIGWCFGVQLAGKLNNKLVENYLKENNREYGKMEKI